MDRRLRILIAVVDEYIRTGEPVGSKTVAGIFGNVSSATIRNDMARLCEQGYLEQPHTSAGRVPTVKGYRAYVDMINLANPANIRRGLIDDAVRQIAASGKVAQSAARLLSELTGFATLSAVRRDSDRVSRVEAIRLSPDVYTVIVVTDSGRLKNAPVRCAAEIPRETADRFNAAANEMLRGIELSGITAASLQKLAAALGEDFVSAGGFIEALAEAAEALGTAELSVSGEDTLFSQPDYSSDQLRRVLRIISDRRTLSELLRRHSGRVTVSIGGETSLPELSGSAVLTTGYGDGGRLLGRLGVIAPIRINYRLMIPEIEYFGKLLGKQFEDPDERKEKDD